MARRNYAHLYLQEQAGDAIHGAEGLPAAHVEARFHELMKEALEKHSAAIFQQLQAMMDAHQQV